MKPSRSAPSLAALAFLMATLAAGCGAKTALDLPDAGPDAGIDGGPDAGPDAGPPLPCVEVPIGLGPVSAFFERPAALAVVDLVFLIDASGSMRDEIENVRAGLRDRVVPGVRASIPDAAFAVALFGEFPEPPHGPSTVRPYQLRTPITEDIARVEAALDEVPRWGNFDVPEAQVEGLYQVATGDGLEPWITPSSGCPNGGTGGACFRAEALPVVMLITDAPMHQRAGTEYAFRPSPHTWDQAIEALRRTDILVLGLGSSDGLRSNPFPDLRDLARATGSLDGDGDELVFDIGGRGDAIGGRIVAAVERLAEEVPLDIEGVVEDVPGDGVDVAEILRGVRAASADPPEGVRSREGERFLGVRPGTLLTFELLFDASDLPPSPEARIYRARFVVRAEGRSLLSLQEIEIVVPGDDGLGCGDL